MKQLLANYGIEGLINCYHWMHETNRYVTPQAFTTETSLGTGYVPAAFLHDGFSKVFNGRPGDPDYEAMMRAAAAHDFRFRTGIFNGFNEKTPHYITFGEANREFYELLKKISPARALIYYAGVQSWVVKRPWTRYRKMEAQGKPTYTMLPEREWHFPSWELAAAMNRDTCLRFDQWADLNGFKAIV